MKAPRRELTSEQQAECARLKAIFEKRQKEARDRGERITQETLGDAIGWKSGQSAVNQYLNGKVALNLEALIRFSEKLGFAPEDVSTRLGGPLSRINFFEDDRSNVEPGPEITSPYRAVKIIGTAQMGTEGYWSELEQGDGHVDVPSSDPDAYALRLRGNSMAPAIKSGWVAVIEPNGRLTPGEYVMVRLVDGECMLKELLYANDMEISLASTNDAYDRRTIPIEQIEHIHAVGSIVPPSKIRL